MIRITSNTLATRLTSDLTRLSSTQSRLTQEMASGNRLIDASDDVPATGRVMSYESEKRSLQQYERNAQRALTNISVSSTALTSINSIAKTIFNLAPSAGASGDPSSQAALATQVDGLIEQAVSLANTQVSGTYLFGSKETSTAPFSVTRDGTGRISGVTYNGDTGAAPEIAISESAQVASINSGAQNQQLESFLNNLVGLRDSVLDLHDATIASDQTAMDTAKAAIAAAQNTLDTDEGNIVTMRSTLATAQFRIQSTQTQNATRFNQLATLSSDETEINLPETIIKYQSAERSYEAALQAGSKLLQRSLLDYI
jgi:flagellar hook-associated protein 3 FlgL